MTKTTHEIIVEAGELIEKYGHIKNILGAPDVGFCVRGAYIWATGYSCINRDVEVALCAAAGIDPGPAFHTSYGALPLIWWNNAPERTKAEVLDAFAKAAAATAPKPMVALTAPKPEANPDGSAVRRELVVA